MGDLSGFYIGTTKNFSITLKIDGEAQDITGDTVTLRLKEAKADTDASAKLSKAADVASEGASGIANFALDTSDTDITPGTYYVDIEWVLAGGDEYVVYDDTLEVEDRVSDK